MTANAVLTMQIQNSHHSVPSRKLNQKLKSWWCRGKWEGQRKDEDTIRKDIMKKSIMLGNCILKAKFMLCNCDTFKLEQLVLVRGSRN